MLFEVCVDDVLWIFVVWDVFVVMLYVDCDEDGVGVVMKC